MRALQWTLGLVLLASASVWAADARPPKDAAAGPDGAKHARCPAELTAKTRASERSPDGGARVVYTLALMNRSPQPRRFELASARVGQPADGQPIFKIDGAVRETPAIGAGESAVVRVVLTAGAADLKAREPLMREEFAVQVVSGIPGVTGPLVKLYGVVPLPKRRHPFLFADAATFARAKARAGKYSWAKRQLDAIVRDADRIVKAKLNVPDEPGQWSHHYVCKKCGARLRHKGDKHVCSKCGAVYTGWPYDQVILTRIHGGNWHSIRTLGLAYALTGREPYAAKAREILLAYADKYKRYPLHNVWRRKSRSAARLFAQTLDEAVAVIGVAWGYDLIYNSPCLSDADRERIETQLLREVVTTIRRNDAGISNWQSWHNAGMAAVGFCLEDEEIAAHAINGKSGLRFQFEKSVLPDGFWYEGTAAYHYYALSAIRWAAEAAHAAGIDVYHHPAHKSLYLGPIEFVFPDLSFPAVNDSDVFSITGQHALYELAYARFGDPRLLPVVRHGKRSSLQALLWGPDELPASPAMRLDSRDFKGLGAAILRQGTGKDQTYVHLDYGPHGGGHGHPDKLTIILFALGEQLAPDPGRLAYAAPLHRSWYRQTFAHNTVCVDGANQKPTTGKLTLFGSKSDLVIAQAECTTAYAGVTMRRTVALADGVVVDVFDLRSDEAHTYDWLYHNFGRLEPRLPTTRLAKPMGSSGGYQHMTDITRAETDMTWSAEFRQDKANVRVTMLGVPKTAVFFGMGMSHNPPRPCPMVVVRRKAKRTTFVSVLEPYRDRPVVSGMKAVPVTGDGDVVALEIARGDDRDLFMVADRGGIDRSFGGVKTRSRACLARFRGGRLDKQVEVD